MRIIDKNTDYYDYLQNIYPDDSITFDRRDSFLLTKEIVCSHLTSAGGYRYWMMRRHRVEHAFLLLQICNTFWLMSLDVTSWAEDYIPEDYDLTLLTKWQNFNKDRVLIELSVVSFWWDVEKRWLDDNKNTDAFIQAVNTNDYRVASKIDHHIVFRGGDVNGEEKHIPILKACGVAGCAEALDVFLAFEEYFSSEKTASERTEAIGSTNEDKITSHGFDVKTSFRGKQ